MQFANSNGPVRWAINGAGLALVGLIMMGAKCGDAKPGDATVTRLSDGQVLTADSLHEYSALNHEIDREDYVKWLAAQRALDAIPNLVVPTRVSLRNFTDRDIKQAADVLEADPRAKLAIRSADLGIEDYVRTSVAFAQAMASLATVSPARFRDLPRQNIDLVNREGADFRRIWDGRRFRVVDDRRLDDADSDKADSDARDSDNRGSDKGSSDAQKRDGRDSDGDSEKGKNKGKDKGKKNGRGDL